MFFNEFSLQQNHQVRIIKLNVVARKIAPYKFGISNCPIKIFSFLRSVVRDMTRSQQRSVSLQLLEWHGAFLGKMKCSLQANSQDRGIGWSFPLGDGIESLPPSSKQRGRCLLGESPITRSWGAGAVCTCRQWLWPRCRSSAGETCRWRSGASQSA